MATSEAVQKDTCELCKKGTEREINALCVSVQKLEASLVEHKEADIKFKNEIKIEVIKHQNKIIVLLLALLGIMAGSIFAAVLTGTLSVSIKVSWLKQFFTYVSMLLL